MRPTFFHRGAPLTPQVGGMPLIAPVRFEAETIGDSPRSRVSTDCARRRSRGRRAHNLLMLGPPGAGNRCGKTHPTIMPEPSSTNSWRCSTSIPPPADTRRWPAFSAVRFGRRTIRFPTSGCSAGAPSRPGESPSRTTASFFLDELPEFKRSALEVMRQPLEDGQVSISAAPAR